MAPHPQRKMGHVHPQQRRRLREASILRRKLYASVMNVALDPERPEDRRLAEVIIRAADGRFAYVSFLADRLEQSPPGDLAGLGTGEGLYRRWLAGLDLEYGRKQADAMRQVLGDGRGRGGGASVRLREPVRRRWRPDELAALLRAHQEALQNQGLALERVPWLTLIAALGVRPGEEPLSVDGRADLSRSLADRGTAKQDGGDLVGAIAGYDAAIRLMEAIQRAAFGFA